MKRSIIQENKCCNVCGTIRNLERHHILFGHGRRKKSEEYGLTVWLCEEHHRGTYGVHGKHGKYLNTELKKLAQHKFEELHGHDEWMRVFGKNYL